MRFIIGAALLAGFAFAPSLSWAQSRGVAVASDSNDTETARDVGAPVDDAWALARAQPPRTGAPGIEPADAPATTNAGTDAAQRMKLNFTSEQPIKPGMFDVPTVWEDEP